MRDGSTSADFVGTKGESIVVTHLPNSFARSTYFPGENFNRELRLVYYGAICKSGDMSWAQWEDHIQLKIRRTTLTIPLVLVVLLLR